MIQLCGTPKRTFKETKCMKNQNLNFWRKQIFNGPSMGNPWVRSRCLYQSCTSQREILADRVNVGLVTHIVMQRNIPLVARYCIFTTCGHCQNHVASWVFRQCIWFDACRILMMIYHENYENVRPLQSLRTMCNSKILILIFLSKVWK